METAVSYTQPQFRGSIVKQYLLVVNPEAGIEHQLKEETANFSKAYPSVTSLEPDRRITVADFLAKEEMEDTILRWMHRIISSTKMFSVALNNYSGVPGDHSIYLRIQDHQPFRQLSRELKVIDELVKSNGLPKAQLFSHPGITIAGKMGRSIYEKAMMDYSKREFHAEFNVSELVLLKRTHQFDPCTQVSVFRLQP